MSSREAWIGAWRRLSPRERMLLALAAVVVIAGALYALAYRPLAQDLDDVERAAAHGHAEVAVARRLADETAGLAREPRSPQTDELRAAAMRVAAVTGLTEALTAADAGDGRVRVTFADVGLAAFAGFIETAGRDELLFPTEMLLAARVTPGRVRAEATLARPRVAR